MVTKRPRALAVGSTVRITRGVDGVDAEVVELYGAGTLARARLRVPILGPEGEHLDELMIVVPPSTLTSPDATTAV